MLIVVFIIYLLCSATGLLLIKSGGEHLSLGIQKEGILFFNIHYKMLLGAFFYVCSFLIFMFILPRFDLSYIYPLSAGIINVVVIVAGVIFLHERPSIQQIIGMVCILAGVFVINYKK